MSGLEVKMEYAVRLADVESTLIWEEVFKLASLCEEIAKLRESGEAANGELDSRFEDTIKTFYLHNGSFRKEIERFASAKMLIRGIRTLSEQ